MDRYDAVVVGAGPNGLAAATTLADTGRSVLVIEAAESIGGGTRTMELTLPGVRHDLCSTAHPMAVLSPYLETLPLHEHGLTWSHPEVPLAHPVRPGSSVSALKDLDAMVDSLGPDGPAYESVVGAIVADWQRIRHGVLGPIPRIPRHPVAMTRFGLHAIRSATAAAGRFELETTRALFAGASAHSFLPLGHALTASFGWFLLATTHLAGWPVATGGSVAIAHALASYGRRRGVEIRTGWKVTSLDELPPHEVTLLDIGPEQFARMAGDRLPAGYLRKVSRFRHSSGAFKDDAVTDGPIPWTDPALARAGTVHLDGTIEDIDRAETDAFDGRHPERPFILVMQASGFDTTRAPAGLHTVWAYAHVPYGSRRDVTDHIVGRIEEHAPGFESRIRGIHATDPAGLEAHNPNEAGGDISGGAHTLTQLVFRPFPQRNPYGTPIDGVFLCSASTPPGAGTHGMCGHLAARSALAWTGT